MEYFEENKLLKKMGIVVGYILSYFLFTSILFVILFYLRNMNEITYLRVMGITFVVSLFGLLIKGYLE